MSYGPTDGALKPVIQRWVAGFFIGGDKMVEHVAIADADRHEVKHASTAANNQVLHSNGNGTTAFKFLDYDSLINTPTAVGYQQVLAGSSVAPSQLPSGLDTALQVEFGSGSSNAFCTLGATGTLTFNQAGQYLVSLFLRFGRTSGSGTAITLNRFLINDVQGLNSNGVKLPDNDSVIPLTGIFTVEATPGMTFKFQILRDSGGINNGGLYRLAPTVVAWNIVPSATIVVSKFVGLS